MRRYVPILLLSLVACHKNRVAPAAATAVSARIGGLVFAPTNVHIFYTQSGQYWGITGTVQKPGDTATIVVSVPSPLSMNSLLTNNNSGLYIRYSITGGKNYFAGAGYGSAQMTLTELDTVGQQIAGTFSGALHNAVNGGDSILITNGQFNASYQITP